MPNTYVSSTKFASALDQKFVRESKSAFLIDNSMVADFRGNGKITLTDEVTDGLGNFSEASGYPVGSVTLRQTDYTLSMNRATKFNLDDTLVRHTGIKEYASGVCGRFIREHVVPEVDAYTFSKGFSIAKEEGNVVTGANSAALANKSLSILQDLISACKNKVGTGVELIAFCNNTFNTDLSKTIEFNRKVNIGNFKKGEINTEVTKLNNTGIIEVEDDLMKTAYNFHSGAVDFGYSAREEAKNIGCLVLPKKGALMLIKELQKPKYFSPDTDDNGDNHRILYHIIYDALCKKSKRNTIFGYEYGNE